MRTLYEAYLVGECHADPERRARLAAELADKHREEDARRAEQLRIAAEAQLERERIDTERRAEQARIEAARIDGALRVRGELVAYLEDLGAVEREPEPELPPQVQPPPPTETVVVVPAVTPTVVVVPAVDVHIVRRAPPPHHHEPKHKEPPKH